MGNSKFHRWEILERFQTYGQVQLVGMSLIQGHQPPALIPTALSETEVPEVPVDKKSITVQFPVGEKKLLNMFVCSVQEGIHFHTT